MSYEATFAVKLDAANAKLLQAVNLDAMIEAWCQDLCAALNAERIGLFLVNEDGTTITSKVTTGMALRTGVRLPISPKSLAGYVAMSKRQLNLVDVYDASALQAIHPELRFVDAVDKSTGFRSKQMMISPIMAGNVMLGVLEVINNKNGQTFTQLELDGCTRICQSLATALQRPKNFQATNNSNPALNTTSNTTSLNTANLSNQASPMATTTKPSPSVAAKPAAPAPAAAPAAYRPGQPSKYDGLVNSGAITKMALQECLSKRGDKDGTIEQLMIDEHQVTPAQIGQALALFFGTTYEPYSKARFNTDKLHGSLKRDFLSEQGWIPLEESFDGLLVMCINPENVRSTYVVQHMFPRETKFKYVVSSQSEFNQTLDLIFGNADGDGNIDHLLANLSRPMQEEGEEEDYLASSTADNEVVKFVNKVILEAYQKKASDIHIEPGQGKANVGVRLRIDGSLVPYIDAPRHLRQAIVARIKIMSDLDISETRRPQDGKIPFKKFGPIDIELRVATLPSAGGVEDVVMRILAGGEAIPMEQLGLTQHNMDRLQSVIHKPYGLFYVCGPTGSGKTTTLHSILATLNTPDTKIWTAEDPVEITQKGLRQVQVNKKAGIDFAMLMRSFLRADPDIIMVGESRDHETVSMGVEASLTGHMVFSTLHTNSAPESITRLLDMGMDPFNFADALLGVLAQRLAKRLCSCKEAYSPAGPELQLFISEYAEELRNTPAWQADAPGEAKKLYQSWIENYGTDGRITMYRAVGCSRCAKTGYKGRVGLHELLLADDAVKKLVQERARVSTIFSNAVAGGMHTLKMDGMTKVLQGLTDLKQVRMVCIK
jgi:type II secretory ATPase GspE/PulE/Tfp pilus assembly ATPase PilB-like protein